MKNKLINSDRFQFRGTARIVTAPKAAEVIRREYRAYALRGWTTLSQCYRCPSHDKWIALGEAMDMLHATVEVDGHCQGGYCPTLYIGGANTFSYCCYWRTEAGIYKLTKVNLYFVPHA